MSGEAELKEIGDTVQVRVEVERGQPGTRRVVYGKETSCSNFEQTIAAAPSASGPGLGAVTVAESGRGEVVLSVPNANLRPDSDRLLVNGALLLYAPERVAAVANRREVPIACATIARG